VKALVIGAGKGIGKALVSVLLANGAEVCAVSRNVTGLQQMEKCHLYRADISSELDIMGLITYLQTSGFLPDVVYLNAGVYDDADLSQYDTKFVVQNIDTNFRGISLAIFALLNYLPGNHACQFVFSSSVMSLFPFAGNAIYSANKAGVNHLLKALSNTGDFKDRYSFKIVYLGPVETGINKKQTYKGVQRESAESAAAFLYGVINRQGGEFYFPFKAKLFRLANLLLPQFIFRFLLSKIAGGKV
jgi:NAD(P)-dependent dehydrogenase (short-subunit alcohol dehydrogenase family)